MGAITLDDNTIVDEPIEFEASKPKSSWFNRNMDKIELTDLDALERSSERYMIKLGDEDGWTIEI